MPRDRLPRPVRGAVYPMNRPDPLRAIILARVSTEHADQATSPDRQVARLEALALSRGWRVVDTVIEKTSGTKVIARPAVADALEKILSNMADVLLVDHLTRLGRNARELLEVVDTIRAAGGGFVDASNPSMDTTTPIGRVIFMVFAAFGEFEVSDRRIKIVEGLKRAKARGKTLGKKRVVPLEVLRRARELKRDESADGVEPSWAEVVTMLEAEGRGTYSRGAISAGVWVLDRAAAASREKDGV